MVTTSGEPGFTVVGHVGWVAVTRNGTGQYCLTPPQSIHQGSAVLMLSAGGSNGTIQGAVASWRGYCGGGDDPWGFQVIVWYLDGRLADVADFTAVVP